MGDRILLFRAPDGEITRPTFTQPGRKCPCFAQVIAAGNQLPFTLFRCAHNQAGSFPVFIHSQFLLHKDRGRHSDAGYKPL